MSNFVKVVQKQLGMNKFVRTKSPTGSKFSKIFFEQFYTGWIVVVHLYCDFSLWRQMAPQQSAKFRTAFFGQFRTSLRKDGVTNYASICTVFRCLLEDQMCRATHLTFRSSVGRWRHKIRKFAAEIFKNAKKSAAELCKILRMVTVEIVINS